MRRVTILAGLLAGILLAGCAATPPAGPAAVTVREGILVDAKGMTLYIFDRDVPGKSNCNGDCAVKWPPLMAPAGAQGRGDLGVVTRADGKAQWAWRGMPLYLWPEDQDPGDKYGDNYNKVWHVVKP